MIQKTVLYTLFSLGMLIMICLVSCVRDNYGEGSAEPYDGPRHPVMLNLAPKGTAGQSEIGTVRVIVYSDGKLVSNKLTEFTGTDTSGKVTVTTDAARGSNNFYIVCNENKELNEKLSGSVRENQIEEITFQAAGIDPPLPMYGKVMQASVSAEPDGSNVQITVDGAATTILNVAVDRLLARINFTAIKNVADANEDFIVEELRIKVCRMPKFTTLKEGEPYTSKEWSDNISLLGSGQLDSNGTYTKTDEVYTVPDGVDRITFSEIYIPEHLLSVPADANEATYLLVDATCRMKKGNTQLMHSIYPLNIGQAPPQNHTIKRNNEYNIYATITGLGAMGLYAEIVAMDSHDVPVNWSPVEGLVVVSDKLSDYAKDINVWSDYSTYSGILKVYHSDTGYKNVLFKYGSLIAVLNDEAATAEIPFKVPESVTVQNDILWYPASYGNPYGKISSWADIPSISSGDIPSGNTRVSEALGDPCKLAGLTPQQIQDEGITDNKQWRMATPSDYNILMQAADGDAYADGYKAFHQLLLPHVKSRSQTGVLAASANGTGCYWTTGKPQAFAFAGLTPGGAGLTAYDPSEGHAVRCIRTSIPASEMAVSVQPNISYQGNIGTLNKGEVFTIISNIPYWTATLIEDTGDPNIGTATDFSDFSFSQDATVKTTSGSNNQSIRVYIQRRESRTSRTFNIRVKGIGFDGNWESVIVTATQSAYTLGASVSYIVPSISVIPKAGAEYTCTISMKPLDIAVPAGKLRVQIGYNKNEIATSQEIETEPGKYVYEGFVVTVPPNTTPDQILISFGVYLDTYGSFGTGTSFLQNNQ